MLDDNGMKHEDKTETHDEFISKHIHVNIKKTHATFIWLIYATTVQSVWCL